MGMWQVARLIAEFLLRLHMLKKRKEKSRSANNEITHNQLCLDGKWYVRIRHSCHSDSSWLPVVGTDRGETASWWWMETDTWQGRISFHGNVNEKELKISFSKMFVSIPQLCFHCQIYKCVIYYMVIYYFYIICVVVKCIKAFPLLIQTQTDCLSGLSIIIDKITPNTSFCIISRY